MSSLPASTSQSRPVNGRFSSVHKWPVLGVARGHSPVISGPKKPGRSAGACPRRRGGPANLDTGTRSPRRQGGRQLGRPCARYSAVRRVAMSQLHPWRPGAGAAAALYAGPGGDPLPPGPVREVPSTRRGGKAAATRGAVRRSDTWILRSGPSGDTPGSLWHGWRVSAAAGRRPR